MDKIKETFNRFLHSRSLKYGSNSIILVAAVIAIAVLVNVLTGMTSLKLDLTANKLYSIGDTTKEILAKLNKDVEIYGLLDDGRASGDTSFKQIQEILKQYSKNSHVKVKYIDPDKNPGLIKQLDPDNLKSLAKGDFVVKSGKKIRKVTSGEIFNTRYDQQGQPTGSFFIGEQSFTGAIKYVTSDKTPVVYFTEGHNENKVDSDYRSLKAYLEKNNYDVKTINLATQAKIPADTEILMIASPKNDITSDEKDKIQAFLKDGGKVMFLIDSLEPDASLTELDSLLKDFNVSLNYDKVKENDDNRHVPGNNYDILPDLQSTAINSRLDPENFQMIMPKSRSINILKNQKEYITITSLMKTGDKAVGEQIDKSRGKDNIGPLDLAVAVDNKGGAKESKIIVMGNGSFMSDNAISQYQQYSLNGMYFFINSMNWMQDKKDDVVIAPKSYDTAKMQISSATQSNLLALLTVILFPLIILGFGLFVWMRRRHL